MKRNSLVLIFCAWCTFLFAQNLAGRADSLILTGEYEKAITLINQSQQAGSPALSYSLDNKKASALTRMGKLDDAQQILNKILEQKPAAKIQAITLTNLGFLYLNRGRNDLALETLKNALDIFQKENENNSLDAAQAMNYLGLVYKSTGKEAQAEEQLQMALSIRERTLKQEHELIAASYNDLGFAFAQRDNDKALDYYEKALDIYKKIHGEDNAKIAIANTNIGFIYREMELYGDAINNLETALKIQEKIYPQAHPAKAFVLFNLGKTYLQMGNQKGAREYYANALSMYKKTYGEKHPEIASVLNAIGSLEITFGKFDQGLQYYQQALKANVQNFNNDDINANPRLENYYHGNVFLYSLLLKAQALESRYFGKTLKFQDLRLSLQTLQRSDSLIDILRQQSTNESDKISLGSIANEVYADGVRIAHETSTQALHKKKYRELAFYFAEKSKSAVLLEAISESDAKSFAGIPSALLEEEKNLKSAIALVAQKLAQKPSLEEEKYLRETLFNLNRGYESFVKRLEKEFPDYFNLKFNAASPSIHQLQKIINHETALLSYFVDEKNSRIYIFQVTDGTYKIIDHPLPKEIDKYITGLRNGLFFNVIKPYAEAATKLNSLLIPNLPGRIKNLVIIPTGRLSIIPFETLLTKKTKTDQSYSSLPYLLNTFSVQYEFSAALILQKSKQNKQKVPSIFLCAPITFPERDNLNDLPATESEVKEIAKLFTDKNIGNSLYTGLQANEQVIKTNRLTDYSVLHFATHGVVDETEPELSRIFLQNNSESEDGNLFAGEIYNLKMDANLVTLSACQTGLGKISKGEGVIGLSRALVYAGAKNLIVSFWSVADESTSQLMKAFYRQMLENPSSSYASDLRQAKLTLMSSQVYAAPYYWAPFILIGY